MSDPVIHTVEDYLETFHEDDGLMPLCALNSYANCGPTVEFVQAALIAMNDPNWVVRARGAEYLGIAKGGAKSDSLPADLWTQGAASVRDRLQDSDKTVRLAAALALGQISPTLTDAEAAFPILHSVIQDSEATRVQMEEVARAASEFASVLPQEVMRIAPKLLKHADSEVVHFTLEAVVKCGPLAAPVLGRVHSLARSRDPDIRDSARDALEKLGQKPRRSLWQAISQLFRRSDTP